MATDNPYRRPAFGSALFYRDPFAALDRLERAVGFERTMVITDREGRPGHSEMRFGDGYIMLGTEWAEFAASPASVGGKNTQLLHVHLAEDVDRRCAQARAAGAEILLEPADRFYGDRR